VALDIKIRYPEVRGLPAGMEEPLSLTAKGTAMLVGKLNGFPLKGSRYKLADETALSGRLPFHLASFKLCAAESCIARGALPAAGL